MNRMIVCGAAMILSWTVAAPASATPLIRGGAMADAIEATDLVEKSAVYVIRGNRYCFYFDGWHGPGWYRCGFAWRRGLGWGGVYGWQGWHYGPAARRYGGGVVIRDGRRDRNTIIRERSTTRERSSTVRERSGVTRDGSRRDGEANVRGRDRSRDTVGRGDRSPREMNRGGSTGGNVGSPSRPGSSAAPGGQPSNRGSDDGAGRGGAARP